MCIYWIYCSCVFLSQTAKTKNQKNTKEQKSEENFWFQTDSCFHYYCFLVSFMEKSKKHKNEKITSWFLLFHEWHQKNKKRNEKKTSFRLKPNIFLRVVFFCVAFGFGSKFDLLLSPQFFSKLIVFFVFCARWSANNARIAINGVKTDVYVNSPRTTSSSRRKRLWRKQRR